MFRRSIHRSDLVWIGLILGVLALSWLLPEFQADVPTDSFRAGPRGKKAFYLLAGRLEYEVWRNHQSISSLAARFEDYESQSVILLLGPAREPTQREWNALASYVYSGGAIVFAASDANPIFDAGPFGVRGQELDKPVNIDGRDNVLQVDLGGLEGTFSWQSRGELLAPDARQVVLADGSVQAVVQPHGSGVAVFVASDRPFDNRTLTWPDNAVLATRLLEVAGWRSSAVFDESLNVTGTPKVVALLLDRPLRPLTFHLFAVLGVFGWWHSRRLGPLLPPSVAPRSDIVAHADAVGMLHYKTRDGHAALRFYLHQLTTELKLRRLGGEREKRVLEPIACRLGRPVDAVRGALRKAATAVKQPKLDRAIAAKHIRRLAKIRRAARDRHFMRVTQDVE